MRFMILCLPRYKHLKQLILQQLENLDHTFFVFEELHREFIDGGMEGLQYPKNVVSMLTDKLDFESLLGHITTGEIDQVISFSDRGMIAAAKLRQHFGMGGNDLQSELWVFDKVLMRQRLLDAGLSHIHYKSTTLDRLLKDAPSQPLPFIVKPANLGASICVELIDSLSALPRYIERCRVNKVFSDGKLTIEQYVPGPELSVEGIVSKGEIGFLGVTESHTSGVPYFVGSGHDFFAAHPNASRIYEFAAAVIRTLRLDDCPFHIELKSLGTGFEVVEVHTRFAGAMIMELVECATGVKVFRNYIETLAGGELAKPKPARDVFCEHLLCVHGGIVDEIRIDPAITAAERVISFAVDFSAGDTIEADVVPVEYAGYVTFKARDVTEANDFRAAIDENFFVKFRSLKGGAAHGAQVS